MVRVMLLFGGNVGDVCATIDRGVEILSASVGRCVSRSSMMVSEAWGFTESVAHFTNQAAVFETSLEPEELLDATQSAERQLGRDRAREASERALSGSRYLSREIDIDIIFYGEELYRSERLTIPHPLMGEREFVLRPVVEIAPMWRHPVEALRCVDMLSRLNRRD